MEGYAATSIAANRKILRKRSFRNIEIKVPRAKKKIAKNALEQQRQALKMEGIEQSRKSRIAFTLVVFFLLGISGIAYFLTNWL